MDSNNNYSQCIASQNGPSGQGKQGEKDMCKIGMLDRNVEEHYQNLKIRPPLFEIYLFSIYLTVTIKLHF